MLESPNPSDSVKAATRLLVQKLTPLNPKEEIIVSCEGVYGKYVRALTGEVLAEIMLDENPNSDDAPPPSPDSMAK